MDIELTEPQQEFFNSTEKFVAMVSGFGAGKTNTLVLKMLSDKFDMPKVDLAYFAPTYPLIRDILYPRVAEFLEEMGVGYKINKSEHNIHIHGYGKIICRTMDTPERIIGFEIGHAYLDEFDTLKLENAMDVWRKIMARVRQPLPDGGVNRMLVATTPEGFGATYELFKKETRADYKLIQASTYSNPYLPEGYIDSLKSIYPPALIEAYLHGQFVNLTSGSVYANYDRTNSATTVIDDGSEPLHIGIDFNINHMAAVVSVKRDGASYAVNEIIDGRDTPAMISIINDQYPNRSIIVYPDASGSARKTTNASTSDITLLREAGFTVNAPSSNGLVKDRVAAYNRALCDNNNKRSFLVNAEKCPQLAAALEQQVYDKNGSPDKSGGIDHVLDASGYYLVRTYPIISHKMSTVHVRGF